MELEDITGVSFNSTSYTYDGTEKTITVSGDVPSGVSVSYANNTATDAGTYKATATLSGEGYNTLTLNATLTIEKAQITGISFSSASYEYDTFEHSIQIVGNVPSGSTVTYKYNGVEATGVTEVGTYTVVATVTNRNYETLSLTAYLYITSKEELLYCANVGGTIYFQNNLDGNRLYTADGNGNVAKASNDVPEYMISDGSSLYYFSTSLFSSTIKTLSAGVVSTLYSVNGEYLATDGTYVYYAVNNSLINTDNNGIYRYPLSPDDGDEPVRIVKDRGEYLTIVDGTIYYSNPDEDDFLYSVSTSASNKTTGTLVQELEVEDIITDGEDLYFNGSKDGIPASAVYKYDISAEKAIKLTIDSGKYLTVIGDYVYYVNSDWLTSTLFGDGICRVSANSTSDNNFTGEQIIENDSDGFSSLTGDGTYLYYYKLNDKHLYRYNISSGKETDLMANFTQDETYTISGYSRTAVYNGETYFTDIKDGGCLYKYDPVSKAVYKVLSDNVDWVSFNGDYMYYSAYIATVYSLYRVDMANNGQPEKIASGRYNHLIFEDGVIYYLKINASGNEDIGKMNPDGTESEVLFETDGDNIYPMSLVKEGNTFWFCSNPTVGYKYLWSYTLGDEKAVETGVRAETCASVNGSIYCYGEFLGKKTIKKYDPSSDSGEDVCTLEVTVNELLSDGSSLYFSADEGGIYRLDVTIGDLTTEATLEGSGLTIDGDFIYFVNTVMRYAEGGLYYPYHSTGATGDLYQLDIYSQTTVKLC